MVNFATNEKLYNFLQEMALRHQALRKKAGFSQSELAKRSGVSLGSLKRFERTDFFGVLKLTDVLNRLNDFEAILQPFENLDAIEKLFSPKTRNEWNR